MTHLNTNSGLVAGTLVHTEKGLVPIEKIKVGDMVLSKPESGDGELTYKRVVNTFSFNDKPLRAIAIYNIEKEQCEVFVTTHNHPFWVKSEGWSAADYLQTGDILQSKDYDENSEDTHYVIRSEPLYRSVKSNSAHKAMMMIERSNSEGLYIDLSENQVSSCFSEWMKAEIGCEGQYLYGVAEDREASVYYTGSVYNFEVEDFHTYYIGNQGVWVHNAIG